MTHTDASTLRIADLATRRATSFTRELDAAERSALANALEISEVRKARLVGEITPQGRRDWQLSAILGATVVQPCVVTLDPVITRIDEPVTRTYVSNFVEPDGGEVEMPEDDTIEPIPAVVDLDAILQEALSLALPPFPRAEGVELGSAVYAEDGTEPMTDEDAKPFAGLGALIDQLANKKS